MIQKFPRLQDMRLEQNLSQRQLGKILHISQRTYCHYEFGSRHVPLEMLCKIADHYHTSVDYLVGRTDDRTRHP